MSRRRPGSLVADRRTEHWYIGASDLVTQQKGDNTPVFVLDVPTDGLFERLHRAGALSTTGDVFLIRLEHGAHPVVSYKGPDGKMAAALPSDPVVGVFMDWYVNAFLAETGKQRAAWHEKQRKQA